MASPGLAEVYRVVESFRAGLAAREARQMAVMARRWVQVQDHLQSAIEALAKAAKPGEPLPERLLWRMEQYRSLLAQTRREMAQYTAWAAEQIAAEQAFMAELGQRQAVQALEAWGVGARWDLLNPSAVRAMAGLTADGSPVLSILQNAWPDAVEGVTRALVTGVALGQNPRKTARQMAEGLDGALDRMLKIARTEQLRAYREATRETWQQSRVIVGYRRLSAKQERTCIACLVEDGKFYPLDEPFSDHVNGRCAFVPVLAGHENDKIGRQTGREWFERQDDAAQQRIMGKAKWEAWKDGEFSLDDLVKRTESETWGPSIGVKGLKELTEGS